MLTDILTCVGTSVVGLGVGLVINKVKAVSRKRKANQIENNQETTQSEKTKEKRANVEETLLLKYGLQSYFDTLEKYIEHDNKEQVHSFVTLHKYMRRILELTQKSEDDSIKSKYWNPLGAISANATKVKLWVKTLQHIFEEKYNKHIPEELNDTMTYFLEYINAEQYNMLKELGS